MIRMLAQQIIIFILISISLFASCNKQEVSNSEIINLQKSVTANPNDAKSHFDLATAYRWNKRYDESIVEFNKALELKPNYDEAFNGLGGVYFKLKDYNKSKLYLNKAINLNPKLSKAHFNLAGVYLYERDYDKAISEYNIVLTIKPDDNDAKRLLNWALNAKAKRGY